MQILFKMNDRCKDHPDPVQPSCAINTSDQADPSDASGRPPGRPRRRDMSIIKKGILATTLAASALVSTASPALARDYYRRHDNTAAVAIGVGLIGLAVGAAVAANSDDRYRDGRYDDRRYQSYDGRYYDQGVRYDDRRYYQGRDWERRSGAWDDRYYARRGY